MSAVAEVCNNACTICIPFLFLTVCATCLCSLTVLPLGADRRQQERGVRVPPARVGRREPRGQGLAVPRAGGHGQRPHDAHQGQEPPVAGVAAVVVEAS